MGKKVWVGFVGRLYARSDEVVYQTSLPALKERLQGSASSGQARLVEGTGGWHSTLERIARRLRSTLQIWGAKQ